MTPRPFEGFPPGSRYTPVPAAMFGPLLEAIDDLGELKVTLRAIFLLSQKKGFPRYLTQDELATDAVLVTAFAAAPEGPEQALQRALDRAVARGTLLRAPLAPPGAGLEGGRAAYLLNTGSDRAAIDALARKLGPARVEAPKAVPPTPLQSREDIFVLYEENIGMVTPLLAEELKDAEATYPQQWIEDAFREAVERNKRSWRYVKRILERWAAEGRGEHGEPGRHPEEVDRKEYLRRYGRTTRP